MPSPFPGMDPYLEKPSLWADVHHELISEIRATLTRQLDPGYYVQIQERVYVSSEDDAGRIVLVPDIKLESQPSGSHGSSLTTDGGGIEITEPILVEMLLDEEIRESFLEVIDMENRQVVTVVEILSPDNKVNRSQGLESFRRSRKSIMKSRSHWVEIDLLRRGVSLAARKRIRAARLLRPCLSGAPPPERPGLADPTVPAIADDSGPAPSEGKHDARSSSRA